MSKIFYSDVIGSRRADITASGANDAVPVFAVATVTENVALNHVFEMFALPPGYSVHSLEVAAEDVMTVSVGVMPGLVRDKVFANRTTSNLIGVEIRDPAALVANTFAPTTRLADSCRPGRGSFDWRAGDCRPGRHRRPWPANLREGAAPAPVQRGVTGGSSCPVPG